MATKKSTKKVDSKSTNTKTTTTTKKSVKEVEPKAKSSAKSTKVPATAEEVISAVKTMRKPNGTLSRLTQSELSEALLKGLWKSWKASKLGRYGYSVVYKKGSEEVVFRIDRASDSSAGYAKVTYCVVIS